MWNDYWRTQAQSSATFQKILTTSPGEWRGKFQGCSVDQRPARCERATHNWVPGQTARDLHSFQLELDSFYGTELSLSTVRMSGRILLRVSNHSAFVWDVEDIRTLRSKHRICGLLGGTLPHVSQQNVFLGVPLILMPEEVVLLVEEGIAAIVDDVNAHHEVSKSEEEEWIGTWRQEREQEVTRKSSSSLVSAQKNLSEEALSKRRKREERRLQALSKISENTESAEPSSALLTQPSRPPTPAPAPSTSMPYTVKIPTSSTQLTWYKALQHSFDSTGAAREANVWSYPSSSEERARCGVYRALWEKGYYMGCGIKFGGDYLVYPGDPLRYHSHFVASVLGPSSPLRSMEIVAHGRLGTATKKAHLLCSWDENAQKADIFSIEWAGFG